MSDLHIAYQTTVRLPRTGPAGKLFVLLSKKPAMAGFVIGLSVVVIAALRALDGVINEPVTALILSLIVVGTWTILFYFMRTFFEQQTHFDHDVIRQFIWDKDRLIWSEGEAIKKELVNPTIAVMAEPVPAILIEGPEAESDKPWPVWLVIKDEQENEQLIIETRVTAVEAAGFAPVNDNIIAHSNEKLPVHVASPLLMLARH